MKHKTIVKILLCVLALPLMPSRGHAEEVSTLREVISDVAKDLSVMPLDIIIGDSVEKFRDWDERYELTYSQFRLFYTVALTAELAQKTEVLELVANFDDMSSQEKALALVAVYVYDRNSFAPVNLSLIENYYPDKSLELDDPLSEQERRNYLDLLSKMCDNQEVICQKWLRYAGKQAWERDFRKQTLAFQTIDRFIDPVTGSSHGSRKYQDAFDRLPIRLLYSLTLMQTLVDEPVTEQNYQGVVGELTNVKQEYIEDLTPRELLNRVCKKSKANVLVNAHRNEAFIEVLYMREFLRVQFLYTRLNESDKSQALVGNSMPEDLTLGNLAKTLLDAEYNISTLSAEKTAFVPQSSTAPNTKYNAQDVIDYIERHAQQMRYFNVALFLIRPKRCESSLIPELYYWQYSKDDYPFNDFDSQAILGNEGCDNLKFEDYLEFYRFCQIVESLEPSEFHELLIRTNDLSGQKRLMALSALAFIAKCNSACEEPLELSDDLLTLKAYLRELVESEDKVFLNPRRRTVASEAQPVIFNGVRVASDASILMWRENWQADALRFQFLLSEHNPLFNMGCGVEDLLNLCEYAPTELLYSFIAWEVYSDLTSPDLPKALSKNELEKTLLQTLPEVQSSQRLASQLGLQDDLALLQLPEQERRLQARAMQFYLLTQLNLTRRRSIHEEFSTHTGHWRGHTNYHYSETGKIAERLLSNLL